MPCPSLAELKDIKRSDLAAMSRDELEELAWQWRELARSLANRLGEDSRTSSRPPSSDNPYRKNAAGEAATAGQASNHDPDAAASSGTSKTEKKKPSKPAGKQPGMKGYWRRLPIVVSAETEHVPLVCSACQAKLGAEHKGRQVSAHNSFELVRGEMSLQVTATKHSYFAALCPCGHETVACPARGLSSQVEGRKRNLQMNERCMVGPMLATFIAALSLRLRLSRTKIQEFLEEWLGFELGVATIERCIHEFGLAWLWSSNSSRRCAQPRSSISTKPPGTSRPF
jgi:hypothetical protein